MDILEAYISKNQKPSFKQMIKNSINIANQSLRDTMPLRNILPTNLKFYFDGLTGNKRLHTNKDFRYEDILALRDAVKSSTPRQGTICYDNYLQIEPRDGTYYYMPNSFADSVTGMFKHTLASPDYNMASTIGNARYYTDNNGDIILKDRYDFNNASDEDYKKMNWLYKMLHKTGEKYVKPYDIEINLGNPSTWGKREW